MSSYSPLIADREFDPLFDYVSVGMTVIVMSDGCRLSMAEVLKVVGGGSDSRGIPLFQVRNVSSRASFWITGDQIMNIVPLL